jgi:hypothetical protein
MRKDEVDRAVLLVYKTRNTGYFNFRQTTFELKDMKPEARREYAQLLRQLANDIDIQEDGLSFMNEYTYEQFSKDCDRF